MKRIYRLVHSEARRRAQEDVKTAPDGFVVTVAEPTRTLEQNAAQWPVLTAIAEQCQLCINGVMETATPEDWKDVLTATYKSEMRVAMFQGRMILLGQQTRKFSRGTFSEWLEFLNSTAIQMGVELNYLEEA